jgi:hypothetical protein
MNVIMLSVALFNCCAERPYVECHYAECRGAKVTTKKIFFITSTPDVVGVDVVVAAVDDTRATPADAIDASLTICSRRLQNFFRPPLLSGEISCLGLCLISVVACLSLLQ